MAERDTKKVIANLNIDSRYYNDLDIESFALMLKDPSYCYKFYWLEAIVNLISEDITAATMNDIIDEMIANAWYSVLEFHIHLSGIVQGEVQDGLERAVVKLAEISGLSANASKVEIKNAVAKHYKEIKQYKTQLTHMVPYRALAGFFDRYDERKADWDSKSYMVSYIKWANKINALPYTLDESTGLSRRVTFNPDWMRFIQDNTVAILGWIQYEKVKWLQNNNPEVPGLVYKLSPADEKMRKLGKVHDLWNAVIDVTPIYDVFNDTVIAKKYDVDHFIPWSFVMNDELWNLMPMDPSLNLAKSNKLPKWDPFFGRFAKNQYILYRLIHDPTKPQIGDLFRKCHRDNLHSIWADTELYRGGNTKEQFENILEKNMLPVYESARRQGYQIW